MKKLSCIILALLLLPGLAGCSNSGDDIQDPVSFYYCKRDLDYGVDAGVISSELRDGQGHRQDYAYLLTAYLNGPESYELYSPFSRSTALKSFAIQNDTAYVQLSPSFGSLSGLDLTLACACITLTVLELADVQKVVISAANTVLDGNSQITMTRENLLLLDDSNIAIDPD